MWPVQQPPRKRARRRSAAQLEEAVRLARTLLEDCLNMAYHLEQFVSTQTRDFTA